MDHRHDRCEERPEMNQPESLLPLFGSVRAWSGEVPNGYVADFLGMLTNINLCSKYTFP
jgi:hypothetical protein